MGAEVHVLCAGYVGSRVASTVTLVRDGETVIVVDPGMVARRSAILDPLAALGVDPTQVTDVVLSHHHPDHTLNAALFLHARVHDHWATYHNDVWTSRRGEQRRLSDHVHLWRTPGHTAEDITTLVQTETGLTALTHLWWHAGGPAKDPYAYDARQLSRSRQRLLERNPQLIIPGHGQPFAPTAALAR
jgi:glyoxylase-like metal-dependent hydrolase (beta-lactamase superfamily II)